jgi:hypothetical protein
MRKGIRSFSGLWTGAHYWRKRPNFALTLRATMNRFSAGEERIAHIVRNPEEDLPLPAEAEATLRGLYAKAESSAAKGTTAHGRA